MAVKKSSSNKKSSSLRSGTKSRTRSSSPKRRSRSPRVKLDSGKVSLLAGVIFLGLCICIAVNVLSVSDKKLKPQSENSLSLEHTLPSEKPQKNQQHESSELKTSGRKTPEAVSSSKAGAAKNSDSNKKKKADGTPSAAVSPSASNKKVTALKPSPELSVSSAKTDKENNTPAFNIPPAKNGATLVIIIDDAGKNVEYTKRYAKLPFPLTIAVLPKLEHTKECAYVVRSNNKELILHQPMQSLNHNLDPGPGKITVDMSFSEINSIIAENLAELGPGVKGLNNHEGSEVTEDVLRIGAVLDACQERGIYFLDSRTTANTQAPQAALERDIKIFEKSGPYIDNTVSRDAMKAEIYKALDLANKNGKAIIIGHVDKSANILPKLLSEMYPYLSRAGYKFATPSMLK